METPGYKRMGTLRRGEGAEEKSPESCSKKEEVIGVLLKGIDELETNYPLITDDTEYLNIRNEIRELDQRRKDGSFIHRFEIEDLEELFEKLIELLTLKGHELVKQTFRASGRDFHLRAVDEEEDTFPTPLSYFPKSLATYTGGEKPVEDLTREEVSADRKEVFAAALAVLMGEVPLGVDGVLQRDKELKVAISDAVRDRIGDILSETGVGALLEELSANHPETDIIDKVCFFSKKTIEELESFSRGLLDSQNLSNVDLSVVYTVLSLRNKILIAQRGRTTISSLVSDKGTEAPGKESPGAASFWKILEDLSLNPEKRRRFASRVVAVDVPTD